MVCLDSNSDYLAVSELTREIGLVVQQAFDNGQETLSASEIEYVLKITSDVTSKIKHPITELTV